MCRICEHSVVGPTSPSLWVESFSDCTNSLSTRSVPISRSYGVQNCNANHCSTEHCGACSRRVAPPVYRPRASARSKHGVSASDRPTGASRSGVGAKRSHASCSDEWALQKKNPFETPQQHRFSANLLLWQSLDGDGGGEAAPQSPGGPDSIDLDAFPGTGAVRLSLLPPEPTKCSRQQSWR